MNVKIVNDIIVNMRCKSCPDNQVPVYRIESSGKEIINCCCENFLKELEVAINNSLRGINISSSACSRTLDRQSDIHNIKLDNVSSNVFSDIDISQLGDTLIDKAIKCYDHSLVAGYIGTLENGNRYALIIGTSDEWVNVIACNRAKHPTYEVYGFSIKENRWSYGSKVIGAAQIRTMITNHIEEIKAIMATQEDVRKVKSLERAQYEDEAEQFENYEQELVLHHCKIKSVIDKYFTGITFTVKSDAMPSGDTCGIINCGYYNINTVTQTCDCDTFESFNSNYQLNDIRRLCWHLKNYMLYDMCNYKEPATLDSFIYHNIKGGLLGVHYSQLDDGKPYAIIAYKWTTNLYVAIPNVRSDIYNLYPWALENDLWTGKQGSINYNKQISTHINMMFNDVNI